eukprot:6812-Pyramimonas_sp.AAC.1
MRTKRSPFAKIDFVMHNGRVRLGTAPTAHQLNPMDAFQMKGQPPRLRTDTTYLLGISFEGNLDALGGS